MIEDSVRTSGVPRLDADATLMIRSADLERTSEIVGDAARAGLVAIAVRDPQNPARCDLRLLPGLPGSSDQAIGQQLDLMYRSSLLSRDMVGEIRRVVARMRVHRFASYRYSAPGVLSEEFALERTLAGTMTIGSTYCVFNLCGSNGALPAVLARLPRGLWLSPVRCGVYYYAQGGGFLHWDIWDLGKVAKAGNSGVRGRLDEMVGRGRISGDHASEISAHVAELIEQVQRFQGIHVSPHDR